MSITADESALLDKRETELSNAERDLVDNTMSEVYEMGRNSGVPLAQDDIAARFEAALIRFVVESRTK